MPKIRCGFCSQLKDGIEGEELLSNSKGDLKQAICGECIIVCAAKLSEKDPVRFMSLIFEEILSRQEKRTEEAAADLEKRTIALDQLKKIAGQLNLPSITSSDP